MNFKRILALGLLLAVGLASVGCGNWVGPSMMGQGPWWGLPGGTALSLDQAVVRMQQYVAGFDNPDLRVAEVMQFDNHFYAAINEESSGRFAFELLMALDGRRFWPESGPNMMWNTRYGQVRGRMGMVYGGSHGPMPVGSGQARQFAQDYLNQFMSGFSVSDEADAFYGYYTMHTLRDGKIWGMLSVNGQTGQVWAHTWHGQFVAMWSASHADH